MLSRFRLYLRRNALLIKILLSYVVTGSILLSVLSYVLYNQFSRSMLLQIHDQSERMLEQSYNVVETYWSSTILYLSQFHVYYSVPTSLNDSTVSYSPIFKALFADAYESVEMGDISQKLTEIVNSNPLIESVYVYNAKADRIFSNLTVAQPVGEFFDSGIVEQLSRLSPGTERAFIPRKVSYSLAGKETDYHAISVLFVEDEIAGKPQAALVFNLKQSALQQIVKPRTGDVASRLFIIDKEGMAISHPQLTKVNTRLTDEGDYIDKVLAGPDRGYFMDEVDGRKSLITYRKSDTTFGWTYVSVGDYEELLWNFSKLTRVIAMMTFIFILVSLVIAVWLTRNMYKPLLRLLRKVRTAGEPHPEPEVLGEYEYLNRKFDSLVSNVHELQASVRGNLPALRADLLKRLLKGELMSEEEAAEQIANLHIRLEDGPFVVVILRLCGYRELAGKRSVRDMSLLRFALMNISAETFDPELRTEVVDGESDHIAVIVSIPVETGTAEGAQPQQTLETVRRLLADVQKHAQHYLNVVLTAAVGQPVEARRQLHLSYAGALQSSEYRLIYGKSAILLHSELAAIPRAPYAYPFELEKRLLEAVRSGERDKALELLEDAIAGICRFTYDEILLSLTQLALALSEQGSHAAPPGEDDIRLSYKTIMQEMAGCDDLDDVRNWFVRLTSQLTELFKERREHKNMELIRRIQQFVEERFRDAGLNVEAVSEHVGLSPNYVRTIFKSHTEQSLSVYISERRFAEARRMLVETDLHANKIAELVGFGSGKYFYSAFKKASGQTPDDYRKTAKTRISDSET
ncbi:helix-turn-helix domain-containing protein [Paenibacillus sp. cl123]|nr:helix-turn-helix domain-containing protein [Paenibacillus sp. cl123]